MGVALDWGKGGVTRGRGHSARARTWGGNWCPASAPSREAGPTLGTPRRPFRHPEPLDGSVLPAFAASRLLAPPYLESLCLLAFPPPLSLPISVPY